MSRFQKAIIAAAAFSTAMNFHACVYGPPEKFEPEENIQEAVYGPPPISEPAPVEEKTSLPEISDTDVSAESSVTSDSNNSTVNENNGNSEASPGDENETPFDIPDGVTVSTDSVTVTIPDDSAQTDTDITVYVPENNVNQLVYGPPSYFEETPYEGE